jgi:NAD(P)-dependent dehydrogenase (short-subunit alcohol dehydrogenase family)
MTDKISLDGKIAIVTGAASGMGAAMAGALLDAGARVAGIDVDAAGLERKGAEWQRRHNEKVFLGLVADVGSLADCRRVVGHAVGHFGGLDILVNNAGVSMALAVPKGATERARFWETVPEGWLRIVQIDATGAYLMAHAATPHMIARKWGRIVNVTTSYDTMMASGLSAYGGAKAALEANTAIWAKELDGTGVTANVLVPGGPTDTAFFPPDFPRDKVKLLNPALMGPPIQWLASPQSDGVTGFRFIARDWDVSLAPAEAAARVRAPAAWPTLAATAEAQRQ